MSQICSSTPTAISIAMLNLLPSLAKPNKRV